MIRAVLLEIAEDAEYPPPTRAIAAWPVTVFRLPNVEQLNTALT